MKSIIYTDAGFRTREWKKQDNKFWESLLRQLEANRVIPVIGPGLVTCAPGPGADAGDDVLFYPQLARHLATTLFPDQPETGTETVNDVICRYKLQSSNLISVYEELSSLISSNFSPGAALRQLAGLECFDLFLTTAWDPLLERALQAEAESQQIEFTTTAADFTYAYRTNSYGLIDTVTGPQIGCRTLGNPAGTFWPAKPIRCAFLAPTFRPSATP